MKYIYSVWLIIEDGLIAHITHLFTHSLRLPSSRADCQLASASGISKRLNDIIRFSIEHVGSYSIRRMLLTYSSHLWTLIHERVILSSLWLVCNGCHGWLIGPYFPSEITDLVGNVLVRTAILRAMIALLLVSAYVMRPGITQCESSARLELVPGWHLCLGT